MSGFFFHAGADIKFSYQGPVSILRIVYTYSTRFTTFVSVVSIFFTLTCGCQKNFGAVMSIHLSNF